MRIALGSYQDGHAVGLVSSATAFFLTLPTGASGRSVASSSSCCSALSSADASSRVRPRSLQRGTRGGHKDRAQRRSPLITGGRATERCPGRVGQMVGQLGDGNKAIFSRLDCC
jgi:hypothetical protein